MSQADVDLVRALIPPPDTELTNLLRSDELFGQLVAAFETHIDPNVESVAVWQGGTAHSGIDGFRKLWLDWLEPWAEYHTRVDEVIDADSCVVVLARDRGRRDDVEGEFEIMAASTWEVRDQRVTKVVFYGNREDALAAAAAEK